MSYKATNYDTNDKAPAGKWTCAPGSSEGPFDTVPTGAKTTGAPNYCGQCVSYVKQVCPSLPLTNGWKKGSPAKGNAQKGMVIATFDSEDNYYGHAAIYVSEDQDGINVYDQYIYGVTPKAVGPRKLRFGASNDVNNGDKFYIVEPK
jgi:hypothetical protein